ncbi:MAG TPA: FAD binding domain-containing protein [Gammaproteobacteria bacterium]|nr:FAD binding domain-containing protein [Gammaproteobacteria bacterium]
MMNKASSKSAASAAKWKIKAAYFDCARPRCIKEILEIFAEYGEDVKVIAGGHNLALMLNMRIASPDHMVDINQIGTLSGIESLAGRRPRSGAFIYLSSCHRELQGPALHDRPRLR